MFLYIFKKLSVSKKEHYSLIILVIDDAYKELIIFKWTSLYYNIIIVTLLNNIIY